MPSGYHQFSIKEADRHTSAFRDARGRLYELTRCDFGLTTIPAVFSAHVGDTFVPVENKGGVQRWLDEMQSATLEGHLTLIEEVLDLLYEAGYSVHFKKCMFCMSEVEFLGAMVGRSGHRRSTLVTDCAALTWLFTSQNLSSKIRRWALRLMQFDIELRRRKGEDHTAPDALSRLHRKGAPEPPVDTFLPDDISRPVSNQGLVGPVLDSVPLRTLAPPTSREETHPPPFNATAEIRAAVEDEKVLDGVSLVALGLTEVCHQPAEPLTVFFAPQLTPELLESDDCRRLLSCENVRTALVPRLPRAAVLGCVAGRALLALEGRLRVDAAIEPDWTTLECVRVDSWNIDVRLVRTPPMAAAARSATALHRRGDTAATQAAAIVDTLTTSRAKLLLLEYPAEFSRTPVWKDRL
ncbi:unnamed protein product [Ectocarpus sp. CCAP 1310/34]|nr:unnamed protein product [Ectocarpus sp. CCAP 1310/34]